jgi:membrane-bound serine protease (ClpP class)
LRRLVRGLLVISAALAVVGSDVAAQDTPDQGPAAIDVLQVSGLIDPILAEAIDSAIERAERSGAQALILQMNSRGAVIGRDEMGDLLTRVATAEVPIGVWVGPSGSRLYGLSAQFLGVADLTGMAPGSRVGYIGTPLSIDGSEGDFGLAGDRLRSASVNLTEAQDLALFRQGSLAGDEGVPALTSMVHAFDGFVDGDVVLETTAQAIDEETNLERQDTTAVVRLTGLDLVDEIFHTVASPAMTYLLLLIGLGLLVFEYYTAGVGIAGVIGAVSLFFAATGLATLPARGWAVAMIVAAFGAFAVDVQVGIPRFWTGVGIVLTAIGSWFLFEPLPGATLRPSWITLVAGIGGVVLAFVVGMPSMVRTRFATPTIGREWMLDKVGTVVRTVDPDGIVNVDDAEWRARTNRATPVATGEQVRVVAIDGVTLEVEPLEGAAKDYRER